MPKKKKTRRVVIELDVKSGTISVDHPDSLFGTLQMLNAAAGAVLGEIANAEPAAPVEDSPQVVTAGAGTLHRLGDHRKNGV